MGMFVIPIHNENGLQVAYALRSTDPNVLKHNRYRFSKGFRKSEILFNLHRLQKPHWKEYVADSGVSVVEGFFQNMWLDQCGLPAVALMGCSMSDTQMQQIMSLSKRVTLCLDPDEAGIKATNIIGNKLMSLEAEVRVVDYSRLNKPAQVDELSYIDTVTLLDNSYFLNLIVSEQ